MKKILSILIYTMICLGIFPQTLSPVSADTYGDYAYTVNGGEATVTGFSGSDTVILIPEELGGYPVTAIGYRAFYNCSSLMGITLPDSVTMIGENAFYGCSSLTSITLPESMIRIGDSAFYNTAYYKKSSNWNGGVLYIGNHLIKAKTDISGAYEIRNGTVSIAAEAFYRCTGLTGITIPDSVTVIEYRTFSGCSSLISITLPDSVIAIGDSAFYNTAYYKNSSNWSSGVLYIGNHLIEAKTDISGAYEIRNGTVSIAAKAFYGCTGLTGITLPDSMTAVGSEAFYQCTGLTGITLPDSVTAIKDRAFYNCISLTSITIPENVTAIGDYAFRDCSSLTNITLSDSVTAIGAYAFDGCSSLISITLPDSVTVIGDRAFSGCSSLMSITLPDSVTEIKSGAFSGCSSLTGITIPKSVTAIEGVVFYGCSSLMSITLPDSVTMIGENAFYGCSSLTSITLPETVTAIGYEAFSGCYNLQTAYYNGTQEQFRAIDIGSGNEDLIQAVVIKHKGTKTAVSEDGGTFTVLPVSIESGSVIILALYNGDSFVGAKTAVYAGDALTFTADKEYTRAKVMVWDGTTTVTPICEPEILH